MEESRTLALLRSQRHSFMNHLQVVSGWLQLGRPDRARQLIDAMAERMATEGEAIRQVPPRTALAVIALGLEAETYGVELTWRLHAPIDATAAERLEGDVLSAINAVSLLAEGQRRLTVTVGPAAACHVESASVSFGLHMPPTEGKG